MGHQKRKYSYRPVSSELIFAQAAPTPNDEDVLRSFLTLAYNHGEINTNGYVLKGNLKSFLRSCIKEKQFETLNPERLDWLLSTHKFLKQGELCPNIFDVNLDRLPDKEVNIDSEKDVMQVKFVRSIKMTSKYESEIESFGAEYENYLRKFNAEPKAFQLKCHIDKHIQVIGHISSETRENLQIQQIKIHSSASVSTATFSVVKFNFIQHEVVEVNLDIKLFKKPNNFYLKIYTTDSLVEVYKVSVANSHLKLLKTERSKKDVYAEICNKQFFFYQTLDNFWPDRGLMKLFTENFAIRTDVGSVRLNREQRDRYCKLVAFKKGGNILTPSNYVGILQILVEIEDLFINYTLMTFEISSIKVEMNGGNQFNINIGQIHDFPDAVDDTDYIWLEIINPFNGRALKSYNFPISSIANERIYFEVDRPEIFSTSSNYRVTFGKNRLSLQMQQQALVSVDHESIIERILFPKIFTPKTIETRQYDWFNHSVSDNLEQQQAVKSVVEGRSHPAPHIIFGPPGTGKTSTIVETICQIWKQKPEAKILVTAPSNSACDEIALRLIRYISPLDLYRCYTKTQQKHSKDINEDLLAVSNLSTGIFKFPSPKVLMNYRIVLSTIVNSGRLALNSIPAGHFQYIIIDECGSATETASLIPIAGLASEDTNVVIAGDPKQLGPVLRCDFARVIGLGKSLLERLMEDDFYKVNSEGKYNSHVITKLLQNFRSNSQILHISNKLFYDGELLPKARPCITDFALGWDILPNKDCPVVFHNVEGITEKSGTGIYNEQEIDVILKYVEKIVSKKVPLNEIGVVSPYQLQCQNIKERLKTRRKEAIEVGSAEQFQGKEKMVIIISTVRSNTETVGFLGNPKRLNVIMTRAKGLLIVIGNAKTLQLDSNWYQLIEFCMNNNATTGSMIELKKPKAAQVNSKGEAIMGYDERIVSSMDGLTKLLNRSLQYN